MKRLLALLTLSFAMALPASAQDREVPYWATIRDSATQLNMRVGPSPDYKIAWVYNRPGLPMKVIRVMEGWRLVQDPDGDKGWVVARLLSPERGAIVVGEGPVALLDAPSDEGSIKWRAEPGVVGKLGDCTAGYCEFDVAGREGWVRQNRLWGAGEP
ncbi:MAG: SH3 domain-containing protein [Qipengyuania sp.]